MKKNKLLKKHKIKKTYGFWRSGYFKKGVQLPKKLIFIGFFSLFFLFRLIKINFGKKNKILLKFKKQKRKLVNKILGKKYFTLNSLVFKDVLIKLLEFSKLADKNVLLWLYKTKMLNSKITVENSIGFVSILRKSFTYKIINYNLLSQRLKFNTKLDNAKHFYNFSRTFYSKYLLMNFMVENKQTRSDVLYNIPIKNPRVVKFNFKVRGFENLVRETKESLFYKNSFKLHKKFIYKNIKKSFFVLKIKNFRWLQTHLNFILDVKATLYYPRFIFFEKKYLQKLSFFRTIFKEYWLAKQLFNIRNNHRWVKFFNIFNPKHYIRLFNNYKLNKVQKLNSTQFNWLIKTQKIVLLKYYYLIKYSKLSFFFYFYLKLLWKQIFNIDLIYMYRRLKFSQKTTNLIQSIYFKFIYFEKRLKPSFFLYEVLEVLFIAIKTKNSSFFHRWLCNKISKINFKKHFKVLNFVNLILNTYFSFFKNHYNIKGLQYVVKGKINSKGSVRKRKVRFQLGKVSYTSLDIRNSNNFGIARTDTGAIGIFFLISF